MSTPHEKWAASVVAVELQLEAMRTERDRLAGELAAAKTTIANRDATVALFIAATEHDENVVATLRALVGELVAECEQPTIKGGHYELIARAKAATGTKE